MAWLDAAIRDWIAVASRADEPDQAAAVNSANVSAMLKDIAMITTFAALVTANSVFSADDCFVSSCLSEIHPY